MLPGLATLEQLAPSARLDRYVESAGCGADPLPGAVTVGVGDAFDLVETGDRVPDVFGVGERFFALLWEGELGVRQVVLSGGTQALDPTRHLRSVGPCGLNLA